MGTWRGSPRSRALAGASLLACVAPALGQGAAGAAPSPLPRAERLLSERGCAVCHPTDARVLERLWPAAAPRLDEAGGRLAPSWVRRFLTDPVATRPHTRMPDVLAHLSDDAQRETVEALVHFLATLGPPRDATGVSVSLAQLARGRALFHHRGCVACHLPQAEPWELELPLDLASLAAPRAAEPADAADETYLPPGTLDHPAVPLDPAALAQRTDALALARFLRDPRAVRPAGRMPDLGLSDSEARDLARWLLREQADFEHLQPARGAVAYEVFEEDFGGGDPDFDAFTPVDSGTCEGFTLEPRTRDDHFGLRFTAQLDVPQAGAWTFDVTSDDGSWLRLDGKVVVANGGTHAPQTASGTVELTAGPHALEVTFFEYEGGESLAVEWQGPGQPRAPLPVERLSAAAPLLRPPDAGFRVDPALAARGRAAFQELACGVCHTTGIAELDALAPDAYPGAPPLAELDARGPGCLPRPERPGRFPGLDEDDVAALRALDRAALARPLDPVEETARALDRLHCYACHVRDGLGGVHPLVRPYFVANDDAELGDEGRFPPRLSKVGAKLREEALRGVLREGRSIRPYLAVRMPRFGDDDVARLLDLLPRADPPRPDPPLDADAALVRDGHTLAGVGGLGCVQCHTFEGHRSLGVQAVDLTTMAERLRFDWFRSALLDPIGTDMNTRMPVFWQEGKSPVDLFDHDPAAQVDALWAYLSQGRSMAFPKGLAGGDTAYELVPEDEPIACGVFLRGVSPRTLVVGDPDQVHYAFDQERPRLALAWRGRFFNARGTWEGRAGALEWPPSDDLLELPDGPPFAWLDEASDAWPTASDARFLGRAYDADRRVVLRYEVDGVRVEERPRPVLEGGEARLARSFVVTCDHPRTGLWLRALHWDGGGQDWRPPRRDADGGWVYEFGDPAVRLVVRGTGEPVAVVGEGVDVLVPVTFDLAARAGGPGVARFELEVAW